MEEMLEKRAGAACNIIFCIFRNYFDFKKN